MDYEYEEVDAHGALDALRDSVTVEYKYGQEWNILTGDNSLWLMHDPHVQFRIRREAKREKTITALAEAIGAMTYLFGNLETPAVDEAFTNFAAALKAEILAEIQEARG